MNKNPNITKKNLKNLYVKQKLSTIEVAKRLNASYAAVYQALKRFGLPVRSRTDASHLRRAQTYQLNWKPLVRKYMKGTPLEEVAQEVGCSLGVASKHLKANGAEIRVRGSETNRPNSRNTILFDVKRAIKMNKEGATLTEIGIRLGKKGKPISVQVISMRFKKVGYKPITYKASKDKFKAYPVKKRKVAHAIGADRCAICPEVRGVQLCHIKAKRFGGDLVADNSIPLCPSHHWFFDRGQLWEKELEKIKPALCKANKKGYSHHTYMV